MGERQKKEKGGKANYLNTKTKQTNKSTRYKNMKKLNQISIAMLCIGGLFKHNSYPYANILVSIGFVAVAATLLAMSLSKDKEE